MQRSGWIIYVPVVGFAVNLAIELAGDASDWQVTTLEVGLTWLVGVFGIIVGTGHLFMPGPIAASIGWPTSRFQWEVGLADLSYGVAGVMATSFDRGFWLATIVVFSIFMLGPRWATSDRWWPNGTSPRATLASSSGTTWPCRSCIALYISTG